MAKPLFGKAKLLINGRDKTKLVDGLDRQVELVRAALAEHAGGVPVHGAMCFVDSELPLVGTLSIRGHQLLYRKKLAKRINARGEGTPEQVRAAAAHLAERFPRA